MESAMRRPGAFNLTAALAAVAVLELFINRVGRLFLPGAAISTGRSGFHPGRVLESSGSFLFQLTAVLALAVLVAAFWGLLRRGELYPRAVRFSVIVITLFFIAFATGALVRGQMPPRHFLFLEIGFAFLALLTVFALAGARVPLPAKMAVGLFALPGILRAFAIVLSGHGGPGSASGRQAVVLAGLGEAALVLAAIVAPLALCPHPWKERRWRLPLGLAVVLTTILIVAIRRRFDLVHESALYALRIDLPQLASLTGIGHVAAFFGWVYATTELLRYKGGLRLAGYGLVLLALGGYETGSPVELSLSLLGLVAVALGELRAAPTGEDKQARVATPEWRAFVGRLLTAATDNTAPDDSRPEAVWVDDGDVEIDRIRTYRRGYPVLLKLRRRRGTPIELDMVVGTQKHDQPDASIERHRRWLARSPEHRLKLTRSKTGDDSFDRKFSIHGAAPLADDQLRARIARQQGDGVITIWSSSAARYHLLLPSSDAEAPPIFAGTVEGNAPVDTLVELCDLLADLIEASLPAAG